MPILKRQQATPALKDAIVLDLGDVAKQAERIRQQARDQADRMVQEAEQRAHELVEGAEAKGREQGYAAGYEQGLAEGRSQGHAEALEQRKAQLEQFEANWSQALSQWDQQRQAQELEARRGVVELALKVAEKLVHRVVEVDETVVADQLAGALSHVLRALDVSVRVHPEDRPVLEEALPKLTSELSHINHIELIDDETLDRGGCAISFGQGEVDASLETQLQRIVRAMLPDNVPPRRVSGQGLIPPRSAEYTADEQPRPETGDTAEAAPSEPTGDQAREGEANGDQG